MDVLLYTHTLLQTNASKNNYLGHSSR